jgi:hypothetical protein
VPLGNAGYVLGVLCVPCRENLTDMPLHEGPVARVRLDAEAEPKVQQARGFLDYAVFTRPEGDPFVLSAPLLI